VTARLERIRVVANFTLVDLFAGAGGFSLGMRDAGAAPDVVAVETDEDCVETYSLNLPEATVLRCDVRDVDWSQVRAHVVVAGPPCQGFSTLGRRRPDDPRNELYNEVVRCVRHVRPNVVAVENVPRFLSSAQCAELTEQLQDSGYAIKSATLDCSDFGVPQRRTRALIVASIRGIPTPWPSRTHGAPGMRPRRTVGDAFVRLPRVPDGANWHIARSVNSDYQERFRSIPRGGGRQDLPPDLVLDCWKAIDGHSDVLGRLEWHKPATTVRTEFFRPEKGRFLHPVEDRPITAREAARLQSFPDSFAFPSTHTLTSIGRQIGNAVPPLLARALGTAIARSLLTRDDDPIDSSAQALG
jgi:DNA (cytosine-5)-methyltransferase 1